MSEDETARIQLSRSAGWRMPEDGVKVDRSTEFGNPFIITGPWDVKPPEWYVENGSFGRCFKAKADAQAAAVKLHADWIARPEQAVLRDRIRVRFKRARPACWCRLDEPCHGDTIADIARTPLECEAA